MASEHCVHLDAEGALERLRNFFVDADTDGSGSLDKEELVHVLRKFYAAEKLSRNTAAVRREVEEALKRFDYNGDGTLQFEEFVDMVCLSDAFKFQMTNDVKLAVRVKVQQVQAEQMRANVLQEQGQIMDDEARLERIKVRQLQTLVDDLMAKLDDKVIQVRTLEDDLCQTTLTLRTTETRLKDALAEVDRLYRSKMQNSGFSIPEDNIILTPDRIGYGLASVSPRSPGSRARSASHDLLGSPQSARSTRSHSEITDIFKDEAAEAPRTPRQGSIRRKPTPNTQQSA